MEVQDYFAIDGYTLLDTTCPKFCQTGKITTVILYNKCIVPKIDNDNVLTWHGLNIPYLPLTERVIYV